MNTDKKKQLTQDPGNMPPIKARKKHIVLFVVACVLLVGLICCLLAPAGFSSSSGQPARPSEPGEPQLPGGELLAGLILGYAMMVAWLVLTVGFVLCWGGGQVISALLAMDKTNKPRWLWIASLVTTAVFLGLAVGMILMH